MCMYPQTAAAVAIYRLGVIKSFFTEFPATATVGVSVDRAGDGELRGGGTPVAYDTVTRAPGADLDQHQRQLYKLWAFSKLTFSSEQCSCAPVYTCRLNHEKGKIGKKKHKRKIENWIKCNTEIKDVGLKYCLIFSF